jgi:ribosomal-protein-alanine N-acetyltransferase
METERLTIRPFRPGDWRDLHEYLSRPEVFEFEPGEPADQAECRRLAAERSKDESWWAVCLKRSEKMIGHVYFSRVEPLELLTWELGFVFNPSYSGNGYATEACRRVLELAFAELGAHRVVAHCDPENPRSWALLERLSMRREDRLRQAAFFHRDEEGEPLWHDSFEYAILAEEWDEPRAPRRPF